MGEVADLVAAVSAVTAICLAVVASIYRQGQKVTTYGVRLDVLDTEVTQTARILERVTLQLAALEERTKRM